VTPEERGTALAAIADEIRECQRCRLARHRTRAVPGEGDPQTEVVFVGEGPGFNEDQQGRPFVGAAGSFLDELIGSVGWRRSDVFITNVVKCRPPGNRDPEPDEMAACAPYLRRQLEVLDPALVVTLGRFSLGTFMPGARISQVHGTVRAVDPATGARAARALAMYHPAAALRQGALKETMRDDMSRVPAALIASREERASLPAGAPPETDRPEATGDETGPRSAAAGIDPAPHAQPDRPGQIGQIDHMDQSDEVDPIDQIDAMDTLASLDTLAPFEVVGAPDERPPETDQMRLF
jgi:uracil-DNA glycosylase family 4